MAIAYCNVTTDLTDVYPGIEKYQVKEIIKNWTAVSGSTGMYSKGSVGQVNMVFDDNVMLTAKTTTALVYNNASTFYYDSDTDLLYVHLASEADPANSTMEAGEDWDSFKDNMRDKAMQFMDSALNNRYATPLAPRAIQTHDTADYEYPVLRSCALLTCAFIAKRRTPDDPIGQSLWKEAWNPNPDVGEQKGFLNMLIDGDIVLQDQISPREVAHWNIYRYASNTVEYDPILFGRYEGSQFKIWRIQIDGSGARSSATFKVSYDGGTTWDLTTQNMEDANNDEYRMYIADGIYVFWPDITYSTTDDYWDIHLHPYTDEPTFQKFSSVCMKR